jgi:hypothetical protein
MWFGTLAPLVLLRLSGVAWYQGEANDLGKKGAWVGAESYKCHFPSMISQWRKSWGQPELPFYYVLLAAGHTAILREAQVASRGRVCRLDARCCSLYEDMLMEYNEGRLNGRPARGCRSRGRVFCPARRGPPRVTSATASPAGLAVGGAAI